MELPLLGFSDWLAAIGLVAWAQGSTHVYPWANVLHVIGMVLLVGGIGIVDLRVIGFWRQLPLVPLSAALTPIAVSGLILQAGSGLVLFAADGTALSASSTFQTKLLLLAAAVINAAIFRRHWRKAVVGTRYRPPPIAKVSALLSLMLWLAIATIGRLIAYY